MPPHIHKGSPTGQRKLSRPQTFGICVCSECIASTAIHPQTGKAVNGLLQTTSTITSHRKQDRNYNILAAALGTPIQDSQITHLHSPGIDDFVYHDRSPLNTFPKHSFDGSTISSHTESSERKESAEQKESSEQKKECAEQKKECAEQQKECAEQQKECAEQQKECAEQQKECAEQQKESTAKQKESAEQQKESNKARKRRNRLELYAHLVDETELELKAIEESLDSHLSIDLVEVVAKESLVFFHIDPADGEDCNLQLDRNSPSSSNTLLLEYENVYLHTSDRLDQIVRSTKHRCSSAIRNKVTTLQRRVLGDIASIQDIKQLDFDRQLKISKEKNRYETNHYRFDHLRNFSPGLLAGYILAAVLHVLCHMTYRDCSILLTGLQCFDEAKDAPDDIRTVVDHLGIKSQTQEFVRCPRCLHLYDIDPESERPFPEICRNLVKKGDKGMLQECRRRLRKPDGQPVSTIHYNIIKEYLARLFASPKLSKYLYQPPKATPQNNGPMSDVWDSPIINDLKGSDGQPFIQYLEGEARLLFSLNEDGFDPQGNRQGKRTKSTGGVYLVCLNLPPSLRYKVENMCLLTAIPGPSEPSLWQISYYLRPIVTELLELYLDGTFLRQTAARPRGVRVRAALCALVCDLPATCRVGGFSYFSSKHFCHRCLLELNNINNIDRSSWPPRTNESQRWAANQWKDSTSASERQKIHDRHGAYWSELHRLPYWNAIKYIVSDSMHMFYLRMFPHHINTIWGMGIEFEDGIPKSTSSYDSKAPDESTMSEARRIFEFGTTKELRKLPLEVLRRLAIENKVPYGGGVGKRFFKRLHALRISKGWVDASGRTIHPSRRTQAGRNDPIIPGESETSPSVSSNPSPVLPTNDTLEDIYRTVPKSKLASTKFSLLDLRGIVDWRISMGNVDHLIDVSVLNATKTKTDLVKVINILRGHDHFADSKNAYRLIKSVALEQSLNLSPHHRPEVTAPTYPSHVPGSHSKPENAHRPQTGPSSNDTFDFFTGSNRAIYTKLGRTEFNKQPKHLLLTIAIERFGHGDLDSVFPKSELNSLVKKNTNEIKTLLDLARRTDGILVRVNSRYKVAGSATKTRQAVLGKERLTAIKSDMEHISLPTWLPSPPSHPGEAKSGSYTADQWRTFCTVNLPITLIRLWGSKPKESNEHKWLENYLHLVEAVKFATKRTITNLDIDSYEKHMKLYLKGVKSLYPGTVITPYQHLSLHLGSVLRLYGPTHAWRCFPFERYNGMIQKIPTNFIVGEREKTILEKFSMAQNLRVIFNLGWLPSRLNKLIERYEKIFETDIRGTFLSEDIGQDSKDTPYSEEREFLSWSVHQESVLDEVLLTMLDQSVGSSEDKCHSRTAVFHDKIRHFGRILSCRSESARNSYVLFQTQKDGKSTAGSINAIFSLRKRIDGNNRVETYALIDPFTPLSSEAAKLDYYSQYSGVGGSLWKDEYLSPILIPFENILHHFAKISQRFDGIGDCILAYGLDR